METGSLSVREFEHRDIAPFTRYWVDAQPDFLLRMGVDAAKVPKENEWHSILQQQLSLPVRERQSYTLIWEINHQAAGHSNINKIIFGQEAFMHLHLWDPVSRKKGMGEQFVKMGLPYFFEQFQLQKLFCEPNAGNAAPNKTLEKLGFRFVRKYRPIPGWVAFEQDVNLWEMERPKDFSFLL